MKIFKIFLLNHVYAHFISIFSHYNYLSPDNQDTCLKYDEDSPYSCIRCRMAAYC